MRRPYSGLAAGVCLWLGGLVASDLTAQAPTPTGVTTNSPTPESAKKFVDDAEQKLLKLWIETGRADWVKSTYITDDTEVLAALANEKSISAGVAYAKQATRFDGLRPFPRPDAINSPPVARTRTVSGRQE